MQDKEYDAREIDSCNRALAEIRKASLADRKFARNAMQVAMSANPEIVGERVAWLLNGSYGYGSQLLAKRIADNTRMNRAAALVQLIGALEWQCPEDFTRDAWKRLTKKQQDTLDRHVQGAIKAYERGDS